jgi:hypothetical protein
MSEQDNTGVQNPAATSPVEQNLVPKERLDELIAQRNQLEAQTQVLQELVRRAVPQHTPQVQEREPEQLARLKEENPDLYALFKQQELDKKRMGATMFQLMDGQDQQKFLSEFGDEAKKYLPQVEAKLQELRSQGVHNYNRGQIFIHLQGLENLQAKTKRSPAQAPQAAHVAPPVVNDTSNLPSSNPSSASVNVGSSAAPRSYTSTIDELEDKLKDVII